MDGLLSYLEHYNRQSFGEQITEKQILLYQKKLQQHNFPAMPTAYIDFLRVYNGIKNNESAILGLTDKDDAVDILKFNQRVNDCENTLILAYDDMSFLLYDNEQMRYLMVDRTSFEVLDEYTEQELELALNTIIHLDDD